MPTQIYIGNDHAAAIASATVSGAAATTATATWTLYDAAGTSLGTGSMTNNGSGTLTGTIESSVFASQVAGAYGSLVYVFVQGSADAKWVTDVQFVQRGF